MKTVTVQAKDQVAILDAPQPPDDGRAVVAVRQAGVCGTDTKIITGQMPARYPVVLGHEVVGTVVRPGARQLVPEGTTVLLDPSVSCGYCRQCRADRMHLCTNGALMGRDVDGGFAEYVAADELQLHPVPPEVPLDEAALLQVVGVCVHAQDMAEVRPEETAVVVGLGVSGLLHVQLLRARGVRRIVGVTRSAAKRQLAERFGAVATAAPADARRVVDEVTGGTGADLVIESVGAVETFAQAIELATIGGRLVVFGIIGANQGALPFVQLYFKELRVSFPRAARPRDYTSAIALASSGALDLAPLLAESYPLDRATDALRSIEAGSPLKVKLEVS